MSERYPTQETLDGLSERDTLERMKPEELIEFIVSSTERINEIKASRQLAIDILDATIGNPTNAPEEAFDGKNT